MPLLLEFQARGDKFPCMIKDIWDREYKGGEETQFEMGKECLGRGYEYEIVSLYGHPDDIEDGLGEIETGNK